MGLDLEKTIALKTIKQNGWEKRGKMSVVIMSKRVGKLTSSMEASVQMSWASAHAEVERQMLHTIAISYQQRRGHVKSCPGYSSRGGHGKGRERSSAKGTGHYQVKEGTSQTSGKYMQLKHERRRDSVSRYYHDGPRKFRETPRKRS